MAQEEAFLTAIKAAPADDAPRLVYADWLDEQGRHDQAEAIRVECRYRHALARLKELHGSLDLEWANRVFPANGFVIRSFPLDRKISVIKLIREFMGCGLAEAVALAEQLPARLGRPILFADLEHWEKLFHEAGAWFAREYVPYRNLPFR